MDLLKNANSFAQKTEAVPEKEFTPLEVKQFNILSLAFMGDTIYDLYIRSYLIKTTQANSHKLHLSAIKYVSAHEQADSLHKLIDSFTEDELYIYKRGRNSKPTTVPRNADVSEYRTATGLEAVLGYLYFTRQYERINSIMLSIIAAKEQKNHNLKAKIEVKEDKNGL